MSKRSISFILIASSFISAASMAMERPEAMDRPSKRLRPHMRAMVNRFMPKGPARSLQWITAGAIGSMLPDVSSSTGGAHGSMMTGNQGTEQIDNTISPFAQKCVAVRQGLRERFDGLELPSSLVEYIALAREVDGDPRVGLFHLCGSPDPARLDSFLIDEVLRQGVSVETYYGEGFSRRTPLMFAVSHSNKGACRALLRHGASIYAQDSRGDTPLSLAHGRRWLQRQQPDTSEQEMIDLEEIIALLRMHGASDEDHMSADGRHMNTIAPLNLFP